MQKDKNICYNIRKLLLIQCKNALISKKQYTKKFTLQKQKKYKIRNKNKQAYTTTTSLLNAYFIAADFFQII